jgi:Tfp pilus assembly protein PilF
MQEDQWEQADENLAKALLEDPDNDEVHFLLGRSYAHRGEFEKMNEAFARVVELKSTRATEVQQLKRQYWIENYNRGVAALEEQRYEAAIGPLKAATVINPTKADAILNTAFAYYKLERLD